MATLGVDFEFFVEDSAGNLILADKILPDRDNPRGLPAPIWAHYDGIQAEISVPPYMCREFLLADIRLGMRNLYEEVLSPKDYRFRICSIAETPPKILEAAKPDARIFGCDQDYISWLGGMPNNIMLDPDNHFIRYAGTHIHVGVQKVLSEEKLLNAYPLIRKKQEYLLNPEKQIEFVKLLDVLLAIPMVMLDDEEDAKRRRQVYGKAGTYRNKPYGIEYRVLGSSVLRHPALLYLATKLARGILEYALYNEKQVEKLLENIDVGKVITAINESDRNLACEVWNNIKQEIRDSVTEDCPEINQFINSLYQKGGFFVKYPYNEKNFLNYWGMNRNTHMSDLDSFRYLATYDRE